jgi:hypothetical protein
VRAGRRATVPKAAAYFPTAGDHDTVLHHTSGRPPVRLRRLAWPDGRSHCEQDASSAATRLAASVWSSGEQVDGSRQYTKHRELRGIMSELDDLKNDAEKYAKDHPQQVKEGEQELEKKLAPGEAQGSQPTEGGQATQEGQESQAQAAGTQQDKDRADRDSAGSR